MKPQNILSQNAFWMVNKAATKAIGDVRGSLLLSYLVDKEQYHGASGGLVQSEGEAWFYATSDSIEHDLCLSYRQQKTVIKLLEKAGVVATKIMGLPAKVHFSLDHNKIMQIVNTSISESAKLDATKAQNNINNRVTRTKEQEQICVAAREETDLIDLAFAQTADGSEKEKSSAKKEKAFDYPDQCDPDQIDALIKKVDAKKEKHLTPETAAARDAVIAQMRGRSGGAPAPSEADPVQEPIDVVTDTLRWLAQDPSGQNQWALIRRTVKAKPGELTDPAATVTSAALMLGTGITSHPQKFRRKLLGFARTQLNIDRREAQTPNNAKRFQPNDNPASYDYDNLPDFNAKSFSR